MTHIPDDLASSPQAADPSGATAAPAPTAEGATRRHGTSSQASAGTDAQATSPGVNPHELVDLDDTDLAVAAGEVDVRGFTVLDRDNEEVGAVDGLLVDSGERHVRLLALGSGGFLGMGRKTRLVPTAAVTAVDSEARVVRIDTTRQTVAGSPAYDPDLDQAPVSWDHYYGHYGYPTWGHPSSHEASRPMV